MTNKESYNAVFHFLYKWYEITKSDDIGELLSLMEPLEDGEPADPAMWDYWLEAINIMREKGAPDNKTLTK